MASEGIDITNVGPNRHIYVPLIPEGGVIVLRGRNDVGKTEALKAISALTGGKQKLRVRQDAPLGAKGRVSGGGIELTVAASIRRKGEAEFEVLTGKLSMADLVDPGIKNLDAADAVRIKALVTLAGGAADISLFHSLASDEASFDAMVGATVTDAGDLVSMAATVKRVLEIKARAKEEQAKSARSHVYAIKQAVDGVEMEVECDGGKLQAQMEAAVSEEAELRGQRTAARVAQGQAAEARARLQSHTGRYEGLSVEVAAKALTRTDADLEAALSQIEAAKSTLLDAEKLLSDAKRGSKEATRRYEESQQHEQAVSGWDAWIKKAEDVTDPSDEVIADAAAATTTARSALEMGAVARKALDDLANAKRWQSEAEQCDKESVRLRDAAKGTDEILTDVVARLGCPLKIRGGRLVIDSGGKEKFYAELSQSARWMSALDIGIEAVGSGGLLPIPQEAWEGLDFANRRLIAERIQGSGVNIVTAEATRSTEDDCEGVTATVFTNMLVAKTRDGERDG